MVDTVKGRVPPSPGDADLPPSPSLDTRLVEAALRLLAHVPAERLSLRQVAVELGVSHQAPYVHFRSKREFLAAVAGTGLQRAGADAASVVASAGRNPRRRLHALADAYLSFIRTDPHLHDLAYGSLVTKADHPLLQHAAAGYWALLEEVVAGCQPPGVAQAEVLRRCAVAWGTVYGLARLGALGQIPQSVLVDDVGDLLHEALDTLYEGWQAGRPARRGAARKASPAKVDPPG